MTKLEIFQYVPGALKDSLENRLRKAGYMLMELISQIIKQIKTIRMTLYLTTPKRSKTLKRLVVRVPYASEL